MKSLGALAVTYQQVGAVALADLVKVTRRDSQIFGFSGLPYDITFAGVLYRAALGYMPTAATSTSDLAVDNLDIEFVPLAGVIEEADLLAGKWDGASLQVLRVNAADLTQGSDILFTGRIGEISFEDGKFRAEFRSLAQMLQATIGRTTQRDCDADLGDARCKVNLAPLTVSGTLTAVTSASAVADSGRAEAVGYFDYGLMTFTSGANNGFAREVKAHTSGGALTVKEGFPYAPAVGDAYSIYPGCNKTDAHCKTKFSNFVNFRGFPHIIGTDAMLRVGGA